MKTCKRIISLCLILCLACTLLTPAAFAAEGNSSYELLGVVDGGQGTAGTVTVPAGSEVTVQLRVTSGSEQTVDIADSISIKGANHIRSVDRNEKLAYYNDENWNCLYCVNVIETGKTISPDGTVVSTFVILLKEEIADGTEIKLEPNPTIYVAGSHTSVYLGTASPLTIRISGSEGPNPPEPVHSAVSDWSVNAESHWHACSVAGCTEHQYDRAAHIRDGGTVTREPTATESGEQTFRCSVCEYVMGTEEIPATGEHVHTYSDWETTRAATCTEEGEATRTCSNADGKCTEPTQTQSIRALGHDWGEWRVVRPATATRDGERARTCQRCDEVETGTIPATGGGGGGTPTRPDTPDRPTPTPTIPDNPTPLDPGTTIVDPDVPLAGSPFEDVNPGDWFYDAVLYVYGKGLMVGTSDTLFSPNLTTQRGMIVTILHRLEGTPAAAASAFADVEAGQWYADAVGWGAANGVVIGYSDTEFRPLQNITREQLAAILYRYAQLKGYDTSKRADLSGYSDASAISAYALEAMRWAVAEGLITGKTETTLVPGGEATRAEAAMILMRFCETVAVAPAANETQGLPDGI